MICGAQQWPCVGGPKLTIAGIIWCSSLDREFTIKTTERRMVVKCRTALDLAAINAQSRVQFPSLTHSTCTKAPPAKGNNIDVGCKIPKSTSLPVSEKGLDGNEGKGVDKDCGSWVD